MKKKEITELRKKSVDDLKKRVIELKRELMNLRFQKSSGELEKTHRFRIARREVASIKTIIGAKQTAQS